MDALRLFSRLCGDCKPFIATPATLETPREDQLATFSRQLNITNNYADHNPPSVREHIQNWHDGCVALARDQIAPAARISFVYTDVEVVSQAGPDQAPLTSCWTFTYKGFALGWLGIQSNTSQTHADIHICNYSTFLPLSILALGHTSKRGDDQMGGRFGEGVKVEINRLTDANIKVEYLTGYMHWSFRYTLENDDKILTLDCNLVRSPPQGPQNSLISLYKVPYGPSGVFKELDYLFLFPKSSFQAIRCDNNIELHLLPQISGRVYLKGIFCRSLDELNGLCFDIYGNVKISRDRDNVRSNELLPQTLSAYRPQYKNSPELLKSLTRVLYAALKPMHLRHSILHYHYQSKNRNAIDLANHLVEYFLEQYPNSIPESVHAPESKQREADMFGTKLVPVSDHLLAWLRASPQCPTIQSLWQRESQIVLALPEYVTQDELPPPYQCTFIPILPNSPAESLAKSLKSMMNFFKPYVKPEQLRFKQFLSTSKNTRRMIPLSYNGVEYYIIDNELLDPDMIHISFKQSDPDFTCQGGKCGCIREAIIDDLLTVLRTETMNRSLVEKRIRLSLLSLYNDNVVTRAISNDVKLEEEKTLGEVNKDANQTLKDMKDLTDKQEAGGGKTLNGVTGERSKHGIATEWTSKLSALIHHCHNVQVGLDSSGKEENQNQNDESCCDVSHFTDDLIQTVEKEELKIYVNKNSNHPLLRGAEGITSSVYCFAAIVLGLNKYVFKYKLGEKRVSLFWEDEDKIAFNIKGELYFNVRYAEVLIEGQGAGVENLLDMYFPVFAHEIAHNHSSKHNSEHENAMQGLVTKCLGEFIKFRGLVAGKKWEEFCTLNVRQTD